MTSAAGMLPGLCIIGKGVKTSFYNLAVHKYNITCTYYVNHHIYNTLTIF